MKKMVINHSKILLANKNNSLIINKNNSENKKTMSTILVLVTLLVHMIMAQAMYQTNSSPPPRMRVPLKVPVIKGRVPYSTLTPLKGSIYSSSSSSSSSSLLSSASSSSLSPSLTPSPSSSSTSSHSPKPTPIDQSSFSSSTSYQTYTERPMILPQQKSAQMINENNKLNHHHNTNSNNNNNNNKDIDQENKQAIYKIPGQTNGAINGQQQQDSGAKITAVTNAITVMNSKNNNNNGQPMKKKMNRFPLNELVNVIAQAAINGEIPFNKVDLNKPFKMQQLQIPILLLRPEDIYKASGSNNINFKLITAQPIRIPIYEEPPSQFQPRRPSIHNRHRQRDFNQFNNNNRPGRQYYNNNSPNRLPPQHPSSQSPPGPPPQGPPVPLPPSRYNTFQLPPPSPSTQPALVPPFRHVPPPNYDFGNGGRNVAFWHNENSFNNNNKNNNDRPYGDHNGFNKNNINNDVSHNNFGPNHNNHNNNFNDINNNFGSNNNNVMNDPYVLFNDGQKHPNLDFRKHNQTPQQSDHVPVHRPPQSNFNQNRAPPPPSPPIPNMSNFNEPNHHHQENYDNGQDRDRDHSNDFNNQPEPPKPDALKIIPAPKLDKPLNDERLRYEMHDPIENDYNNRAPNSRDQDGPPFLDHSHSHPSQDNPDSHQFNAPNNSQLPKKRTRPVIRIKAERPPIRINSVGQIKLKPERQMRLQPKVKYMDKNNEIPMDTNGGDGYEKQPEQSLLNPRIHHSQKKAMSAYSHSPTRSKIIPEKYLQKMPFRNEENTRNVPYNNNNNSNKKFPQPDDFEQNIRYHKSKPIKNDQRTSVAHSKSSSSPNEDEKPVDFGSVFRPGSQFSNSEIPDQQKSGQTTIRAEGLEQLEKNTYDRQLLKTLKNLMVTGGKRHKLDFEDKEGEIQKIQSKGKIPEKYLKQFPSEGKYSLSSDRDINNSDIDDNHESVRDYDPRNNFSQNESYNEDTVEETSEDQTSDEGYENISREIRRYRVKGFDPNYEYISPGPHTTGADLGISEAEHPTAITEEIGQDGRKVKTYVLSGVYRKKVDEIVRNEADQDGYSNRGEESQQVMNYIKPDIIHEQKLRELLEKCEETLGETSTLAVSVMDPTLSSTASTVDTSKSD